MLKQGQIGIHPPGALGVAFYMHAKANCFIGRSGDGITHLLKEAGSLCLRDGEKRRMVSLTDRVFTNLLEVDALYGIPELLLVCCNPVQIGHFTEEMARFVESLSQRGYLRTYEDIQHHVPILLILPNGIVAEQTLQTYAEQLNESVLMDRLPGVTEPMIKTLLDRIVRGISLQAGGRTGSGVDTEYILEPKGSLVFAGGGDEEQGRIEAILDSHEYTHAHIRGAPATRIEFDKAMMSIVLNVGGLIHAINESGEIADLRMGDLLLDSSKSDFVRKITHAVFDTGQACGAYGRNETYEEIWAAHREIILKFADHVISSLKAFRDASASGLDSVSLLSNEEWILTPLCRYAASAGMKEAEDIFQSLRHQVQLSMARAIKFRKAHSLVNGQGEFDMKLLAQRNIGVELFEAGDDDLVLIGTMQDGDHLIKLEVVIHLADEQITRSTLNMTRAPFPVCHEIESIAGRLVGLRIERGVLKPIGERIGGHIGCPHIKELATNIVYVAGSYLTRRRAGVEPAETDVSRTPPDVRFRLTKGALQDSCLAYSQSTPAGLDEQIGIARIGEEHTCAIPLGEYEPSLGVLLRDRSQRWGKKVYLRYRRGSESFEITWTEFARQVFQISANLLERNVRPDDRVCIISENRTEMYALEMAVMSIGAVSIPVFAGYQREQIAYVLRHARPRFVVVSGVHQLDKIERDRHACVEEFFCMDFDRTCQKWGAIDFAQLTEKNDTSSERLNTRIEAVRPNHVCMVMYTSGTTGPPKGVQLSHGNLISQQKAMSLLWDVSETDVFLSYLPWHHSFGGLFERFMSLYNGSELCLDDSRGRNIVRLLENWNAYEPTLFFSVPRMHNQVISRCGDDPELTRVVLNGRLRFVFTAAAPLPAGVEAAYREHGIPVLEGWGMTETSPCVTVRTGEHPWRSGFVGFPIPGNSVRVGSDQEILVKGPNVMDGYLDDDEATAHVIDKDGWLHTGDVGEFTKDGLRIIGRRDGAFKLMSGEIVHPQRIENALVNESVYIDMALVVGSGKDYVGTLIYPDMNRLRAWAIDHGVNAESLMSDQAVLGFIASEIERINPLDEMKYQRVKRVILTDREPSMERGELTPSGKIIRKKMMETHSDRIKALFEPEVVAAVIEVGKAELQRV